MDVEFVLVIFLVNYTITAKGYVADGKVKEAVGQRGFFITLNSNAVFLIKLLGNSSGYRVDLNPVHFAICHTVGQ